MSSLPSDSSFLHLLSCVFFAPGIFFFTSCVSHSSLVHFLLLPGVVPSASFFTFFMVEKSPTKITTCQNPQKLWALTAELSTMTVFPNDVNGRKNRSISTQTLGSPTDNERLIRAKTVHHRLEASKQALTRAKCLETEWDSTIFLLSGMWAQRLDPCHACPSTSKHCLPGSPSTRTVLTNVVSTTKPQCSEKQKRTIGLHQPPPNNGNLWNERDPRKHTPDPHHTIVHLTTSAI